MFISVFKIYEWLKLIGKIMKLNKFLVFILYCNEYEVYDRIDDLLNILIFKK